MLKKVFVLGLVGIVLNGIPSMAEAGDVKKRAVMATFFTAQNLHAAKNDNLYWLWALKIT